MDAFVQRAMGAWNVPGLALGIIRDGRVIHARGYGWRDVSRRLPVTPTTSFAIGSCTKAFTATALGLLVDEGKVGWDVPVREYIPELRLHDPVASELVTLRDLLAHRSGLPRHDMLWVNAPWDRGELLRRFRYLEPSKTFRSAYEYNNLMYVLAGLVIERVSGSSWEHFINARLCKPLGMASVSFANLAMARRADHALGYHRHGRRLRRVAHENAAAIGPAGSMNVELPDMCVWTAFQMSGGKQRGTRLIKQQTMREIHTPQVAFREDASHTELLDPAYALGWVVQPYRGHRRLTHGGCLDGFNACVSFMPEMGIGVVVLTNVTASPLTRLIPYAVYDRLLGLPPIAWHGRFKLEEARQRATTLANARRRRTQRRPGTRLCHPLQAYTGNYHHPAYGDLHVSLSRGRLVSTLHDIVRPLEHFHYEEFEMISRGTWPWRKRVVFTTGPDGKVASLAASLQDGVAAIVFVRRDRAARRQQPRNAGRR